MRSFALDRGQMLGARHLWAGKERYQQLLPTAYEIRDFGVTTEGLLVERFLRRDIRSIEV